LPAMRLTRMLSFGICVGVMLCSMSAYAATVRAICNVPAHLVMPLVQQNDPFRVFIKAGKGQWQPAEYELQDGRIIFHLQPAKLGGSDIMLLLNPPQDLDIYDNNPPALTGLKVDARQLPTESVVHLGVANRAPRLIRIGAVDAENALDLTSVSAKLDELAVREKNIRIESTEPSKATVSVRLRNVEYGRHRAIVSIPDASPQVNALQVVVAFDYVDTTNFLLAALADVKMRTDSCFPNYEILEPLNDGFKDLTGVHCQNDVSWASAEGPGDHWVEVTLPEPKTIKEVTVYWAYYSGAYHTSQKIEIQVPEDAGWRSIYSSPKEGHPVSRCTTFRFTPVKMDKFRVFQHSGGGAAGRPDLMWLAEIEAR